MYNIFLFISITLLLLPSVQLPIVYSHGIGKGLAVFIFGISVFRLIRSKRKLYITTPEFIVLSLVLISTSLSIINAIDEIEFIRRYVDFLVPLLLYVSIRITLTADSRCYKHLLSKTSAIILIVFIFSLVFEGLLYLFPDFFTNIIIAHLHPTYQNYINANLDRGRLFSTSYAEALIPIVYTLSFQKSSQVKFIVMITILLKSILTLVGKFRSQFIMLMISFVGIIFIRNTQEKKRYYLTPLLFLVGTLILFISFGTNTVVDRLLMTDKFDEITAISRFDDISESISAIGFSLFGSGLGNYSMYISNNQTTFSPNNREIYEIDRMPHNYFLEKYVETGIIGLLSHILFIGYFILTDLRTIQNTTTSTKALIVSFWSLFSYGLFNPSYTLTFGVLFYLFRGLLSSSHRKSS